MFGAHTDGFRTHLVVPDEATVVFIRIDKGKLREVTRRVSELKAAPDPIAYYDRLIRSTAPVMGMSGLGLARIRAEAGLDVDCSVEGREVSIVVQTTMRSER